MQQDVTLVLGYKNGETQAIEILMEQYTDLVYSIAKNIIGSYACSQDLEDCISNVFISLWKSRTNYDPQRCSLKTWVVLIAKRRAVDMLRELMKKREHIQIDMESCVAASTSPIEAVDDRMEINNLFESLTCPEADIFRRRFIWCQSIKEISQSSGRTEGAVRNVIYRIRKKLLALKEEA